MLGIFVLLFFSFIGDKIFAYWMADKMFYPAVIIDVAFPKYKVEFLSDFYIKLLNSDCLVHSAALKIGTLVAIFDTVSQEYRVGEIVTINEYVQQLIQYYSAY